MFSRKVSSLALQAALFGMLLFVNWMDLWHFVIQQSPGCEHEELPGNQSGVKILVAGLAKTGTRTICHALNDMGINAYHSEDFNMMPWWDFVTEVRSRPSQYPSYQAATPGALAHAMRSDQDLAALLMRKISRCRVGAMAFDGFEVVFDTMLEANPDAKVVLLSWRSFASWQTSLVKFLPKIKAMRLHYLLVGTSLNFLPWMWLLRPLDVLVGLPIERVLREGWPPMTEVSGPLVWLYMQALNRRRQWEAWNPPGTYWFPGTEDEYNDFFSAVRKSVPKQRLLEFDPRTTTLEEVCEFAGVRPCPTRGKAGKAINTWTFERDFPVASMAANILRCFILWVNWRLCRSLGRCLLRCFVARDKAD